MSDIRGPVHLVGIGGMHMSAIAQLLMERGVTVRGSDLRLSPVTAKLEGLGATIFEGHNAQNVGNAALVVTTAAANDQNPELAEASRRGIPIMIRAEMVAKLMEGKRVIAVAGAHGKTTTSSLIAYILTRAGRQPMYLLGGESIDLGGHAAWGNGDLCVVEADEYKRAFHEYTPEIAVVTNVEPDHLDYYGTAEAYAESFAEFARKVKPRGLLLTCRDDAGAVRLNEESATLPIRRESYGIGGSGRWAAQNASFDANAAIFTVTRDEAVLGQLRVRIPGRHFVLNALGAAATCLTLGVSFEEIRDAVATFHGARRRFETVGEAGGVLVMDDYAHHPTEVRSTIATALARFPERRLIAIYQPHTYSRISYLWDEWTRCWNGLDELIVLETYAARETPLAGRSAQDLAAAIETPRAHYASNPDDAAGQAAALAKPGDVVFTIGAGDVNEVGPQLLELLR